MLFRLNRDRPFNCQLEHMYRIPASAAFHSDDLGERSAYSDILRPISVVLKCWALKTTVSWIMVLIRKRYFREHCEGIMREYREKHRIRGVWRSIARRSFRRAASGPKVEQEPVSPDEPMLSAGGGIVAALAAGAGVGLGVGLGNQVFQDQGLDGQTFQNPLEEETLPVGKRVREGIIADAQSFTSSPRSIVSPRPLFPSPGVRWDEQSFQARAGRNYMRKRSSMSSLQSVRA